MSVLVICLAYELQVYCWAKVLGSLEFACQAKGSKVIVVLGHTDCGAVTSACQLRLEQKQVSDEGNATYSICTWTMHSVDSVYDIMQPRELGNAFISQVTAMNVHYNIQYIINNSSVLKDMVDRGEIVVVGAIYDVKQGTFSFLIDQSFRKSALFKALLRCV